VTRSIQEWHGIEHTVAAGPERWCAATMHFWHRSPRSSGLTPSNVRDTLRGLLLASDTVEAILGGRHKGSPHLAPAVPGDGQSEPSFTAFDVPAAGSSAPAKVGTGRRRPRSDPWVRREEI